VVNNYSNGIVLLVGDARVALDYPGSDEYEEAILDAPSSIEINGIGAWFIEIGTGAAEVFVRADRSFVVVESYVQPGSELALERMATDLPLAEGAIQLGDIWVESGVLGFVLHVASIPRTVLNEEVLRSITGPTELDLPGGRSDILLVPTEARRFALRLEHETIRDPLVTITKRLLVMPLA
jgi:hypothetical protein